MKRWIIAMGVVVVLAAGGGAWWWRAAHASTVPQYRTMPLERGELVQTVRATGTVQPTLMVQVGTQVSGPVKKLYVDYNDRVKAGDLVAQIDPIVYEARLAQDRASLLQSQANVEETQARLAQAEKELVRSGELARRDMLSKSELDAAVASRDTTAAQLKVAQAAVEQAQASLRLSQANLDYTTIRSPVDGVVVSRNVSEGQTVVASMSAQLLFAVATDLSKIQVEASVPEADIGHIHTNAPVTFTVDAYEEEFHGSVSQVRMAASTVQNVVTYPVVVTADNPDGKLFPGMTANIICEVARQTNVLKVSNAALRFKPATDTNSKGVANGAGGSGGRPQTAGAGGRGGGHKVWIQEKPGGPPTPVRVKLGITDGAFTEIKDTDRLQEGTAIIVGLAEPGSAQATATTGTVNPFTPQRPANRPR